MTQELVSKHKNPCNCNLYTLSLHSYYVHIGTCRAAMHSAALLALGNHALMQPTRPLRTEPIKRHAMKDWQQTRTWVPKMRTHATAQASKKAPP
jgi:hypothetical protein